MIKSILKSATLSSALLLTGCTAGELPSFLWVIGFFFIGAIIWGIFQGAEEKKQKKAVRSTRSATVTRIRQAFGEDAIRYSSDMLIDVNWRGGIAVDTRNKQIRILRGHGLLLTMIPYRDVLSSEIIEDGETVTKTSRGSQIGGALIGGLALGGVGAIIGGLSGSTKSAEKISKVALMVTINEVSNPVHYVMLLDEGNGCTKSGDVYKQAMGKAQLWHGKMQVLIRQADEEDRRQEQENAMKTVATVSPASLADELAKLGELRDKGVLTEAEFASQKAKLLEG